MRGARTGTPGKDQFVGRRLLRLGCFCGARSHDTNARPVSQLAPVGSNHHSQIQSLVSCHWTRGQSERLGFSAQNIDAPAHSGGRATETGCSATQLDQRDRRSQARRPRSEEHTSELQSPCNLVCRLLLEKKKKKKKHTRSHVKIERRK